MTKKTNHLIQISLMYVVMAIVGYFTWKQFPNHGGILRFLFAHLSMTVVCFLFSIVKKNSSVYDAFWSVIPFYFVVFWIGQHVHEMSLFQWIAFSIVSIWSWRLTLNWARSWSDFSHEDWRYIKLAKDTGKFYPAVNFLGIHLFPTLLVFGGMWPLFYSLSNTFQVEWLFYLGAIISSVGILLEFFADNQLFDFRNRANPKSDELLDTGLWGKMRYPNYLGEMLFWLGLFGIGLSYGAPIYSGSGALAMCMLFLFVSIPMKEERMLSRRSNFEAYQKNVPMLIPRFWKR